MSKDDRVVVACRVADLPDPARLDSKPQPCSRCGAPTWTESTSQRLLAEGFRLLCVLCGKKTLPQEKIQWHPQTSGNVALGHLSPALKQFYEIEE